MLFTSLPLGFSVPTTPPTQSDVQVLRAPPAPCQPEQLSHNLVLLHLLNENPAAIPSHMQGIPQLASCSLGQVNEDLAPLPPK